MKNAIATTLRTSNVPSMKRTTATLRVRSLTRTASPDPRSWP
jgi:hypothetical protein